MNDLLSNNEKNLKLHRCIKLYFTDNPAGTLRLTVNGIQFHKEHNSFESIIEFFKDLFIKTPFNYRSLIQFYRSATPPTGDKLIVCTQLNDSLKQERYKPTYDRFMRSN